MAGHVIDSLWVELGLDPAKFNKQQQEALSRWKLTQDEMRKGARQIEDSGKSVSDTLDGIRLQSLSLLGGFLGSSALVKFGVDAIHAGAAVGRLSRNLGVSVQTISKFQAVAEVFGGSAENMASSFTQISDALAGWKIGDVRAIVADFRALGAAGGTVIDINKGVEQTFLDIAENLRKIHDTQGPEQAGYWQRRLGLDPGLFDAMIQKGETFNEILRKMRGLTDEEADAAGRAERQWNGLVKNLKDWARGKTLDLVNSDSKFNPFKNGADAKDIETIKWLWNKVFGSGETATPSTAPTSPTSGSRFSSQAEKEAFIRQEAAKRGIDPEVAMRVARSEGFNNPIGDNGTSFGAFQVHVTAGGRGRAVGDIFREQTGLDPSDPANERATIQFALDDIRRNGWGAYHGAARSGVGTWAGIAAANGGASNSTHDDHSIHVDNVTINAGAGADGTKIATDFRRDLIQRQSRVAQSDYGQN